MSEPGEAVEPHGEVAAVGARTAALALMTAALWGANPVAVSFSVDTLPPIFVAGLRFALATGFMFAWCRLAGSPLRMQPGQRIPCLLAGLGLFVQIGTFNVGVALSNASHASMLINTFIFWVLAIEHVVTRGDRITAGKLAGVALAAFGVVLILWAEKGPPGPYDKPTLLGDLVLLFSALTLGVKTVYIRHALRVVEPGKLIFWHDAIGMLLFFAWSAASERVTLSGLNLPAALGILYQGICVGGLCFAVQGLLLKRHSASQIAIFSFATPLFGVLLAVLMRGDHLTPWLFVSAGCVALGILLVNLTAAKR